MEGGLRAIDLFRDSKYILMGKRTYELTTLYSYDGLDLGEQDRSRRQQHFTQASVHQFAFASAQQARHTGAPGSSRNFGV